MTKITRAVISLLLLASVAAASGRPDWVSGKNPKYPLSRYLVGIGSAESRDEAADKARAEIAKTFSLSLTAETSSELSERSVGGQSVTSQSVSAEVKTFTKKVIAGINIVSTWKDESSFHYAMAVLERAPALARIKDRLEEIDSRSEGLAEEMGEAEGKFSRLRPALKLLALARSRRRLNSDYRFLNPEGRGQRAPKSLRKSLRAARKAVTSLRIRVEAKGDGSAMVGGRIVETLEELGLTAFSGGDDEDILVKVRANAGLLEPENLLWFWAKGDLSVTMSRGLTGEVFKRFTEKAEVAAREPKGAYHATLRALADKASVKIFMTISTAPLFDD